MRERVKGRAVLADTTVIAICKNEIDDIERFLENVMSAVDHVIVVDDFSTDGTWEILGEYEGDNVVRLRRSLADNNEGFAEQRNYGLSHCKTTWALHMDIDERITREFAEEASQLISNEKCQAVSYARFNFFLHFPMNLGGWGEWKAPQLAKAVNHKFTGSLHEKVTFFEHADIHHMTSPMYHLNDSCFEERLNKNIRYSSMMKGEGKPGYLWWLRVLLQPFYRFLVSFFYRKAFLAGTPGLIFSCYVASSTFNKLVMQWAEIYQPTRQSLEEKIASSWSTNSDSQR